MPYRIDLNDPPDRALNTFIELGALDIESGPGYLAALMPDAVPAEQVRSALGVEDMRVSAAVGRDDESVWTLSPQAVRVGTVRIVPASLPVEPDAIRIADGPAFGTGLHATTALCLEAIEATLDVAPVSRMLDVGTGSGILALAALQCGVGKVVALEIDPIAVDVAAANATLNAVRDRLSLVRGGPDALRGSWPLVVANIRAAELMAMAPTLVRRIASGGRLLLSGIPRAVGTDVEQVYRRLGMRQVSADTRDGWTALVFSASW